MVPKVDMHMLDPEELYVINKKMLVWELGLWDPANPAGHLAFVPTPSLMAAFS